ncbi:MAG: alpha-mannosidase [Mycobacterium sp.]|nr:alpha-mannosidase [Mycobacterium sp.]
MPFAGSLQVISADSTELFVGPPDSPLQLVRVTYTGGGEPMPIRVTGDGLTTPAPPLAYPESGVVEVPVRVGGQITGQQRDARVLVAHTSTPFAFVVAEPGWTMFMISHFHYDPVWWNTQAAYTSLWTEDPPGRARQTHSFDLVRAHLEFARREPEYKFVLAEVDYLKPYWDTHPEDRAELRRLIAQGRVEIMGGAYNEPNTNLTSPETTIRNLVHGMSFQRDVLGADPATAWQLDVFGHDPQFPGMAADAGLTSSSWARGPHHQWGPMLGDGDPQRMQFSSEFEWIAPSGLGLLTHYMPAHYSAGWWMDSSTSVQEAEDVTFRLFGALKKVAATRNVLLPVGTDYTPPNKWVSEIHRHWNSRYTWPKFVCATPSEFFAAVRAELAANGMAASPQTRDMNPIYTGKDVSYIDTKQANRAAEDAVLDGERFAVFAGLLGGAGYPQAALAKAWVQLAYSAHHDAITGSESDQVYLDLLTGWRDAWELGRAARDNSLALLSGAVGGGSLVVWNSLAHKRSDVVTARLDTPLGPGVRVVDADGAEVPALVEHGGQSVSWLARDVPSLGWRAYGLVEGDVSDDWEPAGGVDIGNEHYRLRVDPARGGGVSSLLDLAQDRELIADGQVGNELAVYEEYPAHPTFGEGPWHLLPKGPVVGSSAAAAESVQAYRSSLGQRLVVRGRIGTLLRYTQTVTLWHGVARVDCRTTIDEFTGADLLVRLRWPCPVPGALPVSEVGDAVVGRGIGLLHEPSEGSGRTVDAAVHPWTLENPAYGWFGLSSAVRIRVGDGPADVRAVSVAEVVSPTEATSAPLARELMVALVRAGVTATCSGADKPRYGHLDVDSNLPDTRIALGGPQQNAFTAAVLAAAGPSYAAEVDRQLRATGRAGVWVPAAAPLAQTWVPGADLRDPRALPVLVIAGDALSDVVASVVDDLADAEIVVAQSVPTAREVVEPRTVALLNRGVPSFAVDTEGTLHTSLMRSCTGWPSGIWIDPPRRTAPDGSNFQLQHWTHTFDYALVSGGGDWRAADVPARSAEFSHPLLAVASARTGELPTAASLLEVEPAGCVQLGALKAAGNPLARGSAEPVNAADAVAIRLVETRGASTDVVVRSPFGAVVDATRADLLERPGVQVRSGPDGLRLALHGYEIATVLARLYIPKVLDAEAAQLAPDAEAAQPLYARYWLHNRGPAPLGGLPAVAHLHPHAVEVAADAKVVLRLTAASDCTDAVLRGTVRLRCPDGWSSSATELPFELPPGEHVETDIVLTIPPDTAPGCYPVRAQLTVSSSPDRDLPTAWRQVVEDVCTVTVGSTAAELLRLIGGPEEVAVTAGETARLGVVVGTDAHADLAVEAHLISPWGTWEWIGPAAVGAVLPAGGTVELGFDVAPPAWLEPGQWWALVRIGCAGRLVYSPAVRVTVR